MSFIVKITSQIRMAISKLRPIPFAFFRSTPLQVKHVKYTIESMQTNTPRDSATTESPPIILPDAQGCCQIPTKLNAEYNLSLNNEASTTVADLEK